MIEKVTIHNFRCFQDIEVTSLKRVNLLVGPNSSGKSAFLESLFISSSSVAPNTTFQLRTIRRMGNQIVGPTDILAYRGLWEDLFYEFNEDKKIWIKVGGNPNSDSRSLSIEFLKELHDEIPFGRAAVPPSGAQPTTAMRQIEFKWKRTGYREVVSRPEVQTTGQQTGIKVDAAEVQFFPAIWFTPTGGDQPEENAKRYAELEKRGQCGKIKAAIRKEFPFIKDLSILYQAGVPMVFAEFEREGRSRKMPVALVSDGINRLLGICIGIGYFAGGMVLIDQIEDGIHYKVLPAIWGSLHSLSRDFNVQLFVSTHSKECMEAMLPVVKNNEADFCLLRAARTENSGCTIDSLPGDYLETALEQEFEVR